jgi:NAD(P)-dependent dehydrogenase (short-subunit alcohol dehydrogenase family)
MLLDSRNILVFAATGAIGGETARKFAREGAHVWVSGRNRAALDALVTSIAAEGCAATADVVDATDAEAVEAYVARVAQQAGRIDGVFNGIGGRPVAVAAVGGLHDPAANHRWLTIPDLAHSGQIYGRAGRRRDCNPLRHAQRHGSAQRGGHQRGLRRG